MLYLLLYCYTLTVLYSYILLLLYCYTLTVLVAVKRAGLILSAAASSEIKVFKVCSHHINKQWNLCQSLKPELTSPLTLPVEVPLSASVIIVVVVVIVVTNGDLKQVTWYGMEW